MDWEDLKCFLLVAREGGLTAAARAAGVSPATVGRRIAALEAALGKRLVDRRPEGYALTADGEALRDRAEGMEATVHDIARWIAAGAAGRTVRISAGTWTSWFLARRIDALLRPDDAFRIAFLPAEERLDIGRRAADLGLRAQRPSEAYLAGRRLGRVAFALYARPGAPDRPIVPTGAVSAGGRWQRARAAEARIEASSPRLILDLALAGAGRALLPCFVGEATPDLVRVGPPLAELAHDQWLVAHHDDRHDPAIRTVARRIARLLQAERAAFAGPADPG
jgi:DNA-binding transcriptional LysR family regulator